MRRALSIVLMLLGGLSALLSMFGVWFHLEIGPRHGPGLEVAVAALAASAVCFCAAYLAQQLAIAGTTGPGR